MKKLIWGEPMTFGRALMVVWWRGILGCTWRRVSRAWCDRYQPEVDFAGNQIHGADLCEATCKKLRVIGDHYSGLLNSIFPPLWLSNFLWKRLPKRWLP